MSLKDYKKEELQNMGYDDLAALVLEDAGKQMKIMDIFEKINEILESVISLNFFQLIKSLLWLITVFGI